MKINIKNFFAKKKKKMQKAKKQENTMQAQFY